jgi:cobalt-zinc-cadmium efflux system protein
MMHEHGVHEIETKNIKTAFILNAAFVVIEIAGGFLTNSMAVLSDAAHDLGDSASLGIAWYLQKVAKRESNDKLTYGYRRYSVLGAIVNLVILLVGCFFIIHESIPRIYHPEEVHSLGMFFLAIAGVTINYLAMKTLQKGTSINEKVISLHFLEDVLGWVAVLLSSVAMLIWDIPIIDPILSLLIATYILYNVFRNSRVTFEVILQRTPHNVDLEHVRQTVLDFENVKGLEDLHVWSLDGEYHIGSAVIVFESGISTDQIESTFEGLHEELKKENIQHVTFEPKFLH